MFCAYTRIRYQVSVYRPLVLCCFFFFVFFKTHVQIMLKLCTTHLYVHSPTSLWAESAERGKTLKLSTFLPLHFPLKAVKMPCAMQFRTQCMQWLWCVKKFKSGLCETWSVVPKTIPGHLGPWQTRPIANSAMTNSAHYQLGHQNNYMEGSGSATIKK